MTEQRRNDLGSKIMIGMILGCVGTILGLFVNVMYGQATEGVRLGHKNEVQIATMQSAVFSISNDLKEIKELLRRRVP